ncbi:MAG: hypothetical protein JXB00_04125 [Bacteroidales bacterium]|nr:hypothetical protein [Bacteroidales bacterium]
MKRLKNIAYSSILLLYLVVMSGTIADTRKELLCNEMNVILNDPVSTGFFSPAEITDIITNKKNVLGKPVKDINLKEIEKILLQHSAVASAQCYLTEDGKLNICVTHREPVVRITNRNNKTYYLDKEGYIFYPSKQFAPRVLVANGKISEPFALQKTKNIFEKNPDNIPNSRQTIYHLLRLVNYINSSVFWSSQIEQVYVNDHNEFELIPRVGAHIILFGRINDMEEKFTNLKTLYLEGFNKSGWNDYLFINLKFKNQIICTKR